MKNEIKEKELKALCSNVTVFKVMKCLVQKNSIGLIKILDRGYSISIDELEIIRSVFSSNTMDEIISACRDISCMYETFYKYLVALKGETQTAKFICKRCLLDNWSNLWNELASVSIPTGLLVENKCWIALFAKGEWEILAKYNQHELIIKNFKKIPTNQVKIACAILERDKKQQLSIELGVFEPLLHMENGEDILFMAGQYRYLYQEKYNLHHWNLYKLYQKLCSVPRGIELLHEAMDYDGLILGGAIGYLVEKELWCILAYYGLYDQIDWLKWRDVFKKYPSEKAVPCLKSHDNHCNKTVRVVYEESLVKAGKYELMAIDRIALSVLCQKNFSLWMQSFFKAKREELLVSLYAATKQAA